MTTFTLQLKALMVVGIAVCKDAFSQGTVVVGFVASTNPIVFLEINAFLLQGPSFWAHNCL